jgi:hypothetical protein
MTTIRKLLTYSAVAASLTLGGVAVFSAPASAHVVCNSAGDCWSTHSRHKYPSDLQIRFYSDRYAHERYRNRHWRNHHRNWRDEHHEDDRGYYRDGIWITF